MPRIIKTIITHKFLSTACVSAALLLSTAHAQPGSTTEAGTTGILSDVIVGIPHSAFFGLSFDGNRGIAVGMAGAIVETEDGGDTWTRSDSGTELALLSVDRAGDHTIIVGQLGTVLVANDDGGWDVVDPGFEGRILSVSVNSSGLAYIGAEFGVVLKSTDGGRTWSEAAPDWLSMADEDSFGTAEPHVYAVHVAESGEVTIAGEFGVIMRTYDQGENWEVTKILDAQEPTIFAMYIDETAESNSYAVGQRGELLISQDAGKTWQKQPTGIEENFLGVAPGANGEVVITGMRVMAKSLDHGATWTPIEEGDAITDWYQVVRYVPTAERILAVGHSGKIIEIQPRGG